MTSFATNLLIAGVLRPGAGQPRPVICPTTEEQLTNVPDASGEDLREALTAAQQGWPQWDSRPPAVRARVLRDIATAIGAQRDRLASTIVKELGKPIAEALGEAEAAASYFSYYASLLDTLTDEVVYTNDPSEILWSRRRPHGVVGAIIPWNYPAALTSRKVAPAIAAGNAIVLKVDEKTPLSGLVIAEILAEVPELPAGLVNVITGAGDVIGDQLVRSPMTDFITMTGSAPAGRAILAAAAPAVKPVSLELGGNAPFIVLPSADLDQAAADLLVSRHTNCGQVCISSERVYLHSSIYDEFLEKYLAKVRQLVPADPEQPDTRIGPKVSGPELEKTLSAIERSVAAGARVLIGGGRPVGAQYERGFWIEPTVLVDITDDMAVMAEEMFGPVTPISRFDSWAEVVTRANNSEFGLSAYVYTSSLQQAHQASNDLRYGEVYVNRVGPEEINGYHTGWRTSGLGGEDGSHGLEHYFQRQSAYVRYGLS